MENLQVRKLKKADTGDIARILAAITQAPVKFDLNKIVEERARSAGDVSLVAELDGKVVGYMISYVLSGGFGIEKSAWIAMLGVDPKLMGQGIGHQMARETFEIYKQRGIKTIFTSVRWDSTDLLSFFKILGFDRSNFINLRKVLDE